MLDRPETQSDTIVARATPAGPGAVAIVRLSGPEAIAISDALRHRGGRDDGGDDERDDGGDVERDDGGDDERGRADLAVRVSTSHRLRRAKFFDRHGLALDDGMIVEMHGPRSYTGEDVVELHLHGAVVIVESLLERCVELGARPAQAGEYTLRAFLNGRLDLAQAESVGDLISARSESQRRTAAAQVQGGLSERITPIVERLEQVLAHWRSLLDFPEYMEEGENVHQLNSLHGLSVIEEVSDALRDLRASARLTLQRGQRIVLCGAPNVGKSTLLNAWAGERRVLVHEAPGTTRDPVEVDVQLADTTWCVVDTAGMRADADALEAEGMQLALRQIQRADLALWLVDPTNPVWPPADMQVTIVASKADTADHKIQAALTSEAEQLGLAIQAWICATTGQGLQELGAALASSIEVPDDAVVVRQRHASRIDETQAALGRLATAVQQGGTLDVLVMDLELAVSSLGKILGRDVETAVLENIFSQFCIGK